MLAAVLRQQRVFRVWRRGRGAASNARRPGPGGSKREATWELAPRVCEPRRHKGGPLRATPPPTTTTALTRGDAAPSPTPPPRQQADGTRKARTVSAALPRRCALPMALLACKCADAVDASARSRSSSSERASERAQTCWRAQPASRRLQNVERTRGATNSLLLLLLLRAAVERRSTTSGERSQRSQAATQGCGDSSGGEQRQIAAKRQLEPVISGGERRRRHTCLVGPGGWSVEERSSTRDRRQNVARSQFAVPTVRAPLYEQRKCALCGEAIAAR